MPDYFLPEQADQGEQVRRDENGRFVKGSSGNPAGRPPRARSAAVEAAEAVLDGAAPQLAQKALELALGGDVAALRLCLRHVVAPRRERAGPVALPPMQDAGDLARVMAAVAEAVAAGELSPAEAADLAQVFGIFARAIDASEFERRLRQAEANREPRS
jgi:hypothetical protein